MSNMYDEESHTYYINGKTVPSVTEIAKPISFGKLQQIPQQVLAYKADLGTRVHAYLEEYCIDGGIDFEEVDNDCLPYIYAFDEWYKTYRPKILYTELEMYSNVFDELKFAGRTDLVCEIDGKIYNIDYKTTATIDKKSLSVQLYGYDYLLFTGFTNEMKNIHCSVDKSCVLQLKRDQNYVFKEIEKDKEWFDLLLKHSWKMRG